MIPLSIYLGSLAFGGVLLVASAFGGHGDGADGGGGGGHDHGGGADHDASHPSAAQATLLPFLSLRFWTFALAFFGLTGAALTAVGSGAGIMAPLLAGGVGVGAGYGAARILGALSRKSVGLLGPASSHIGREGKLLLPVDKQQRGKIRVSVGGMSSDLLAETEADEALPTGSTALIVGLRGNVVLIERSPAPPPEKKETS